jgi:hypothetical protein
MLGFVAQAFSHHATREPLHATACMGPSSKYYANQRPVSPDIPLLLPVPVLPASVAPVVPVALLPVPEFVFTPLPCIKPPDIEPGVGVRSAVPLAVSAVPPLGDPVSIDSPLWPVPIDPDPPLVCA